MRKLILLLALIFILGIFPAPGRAQETTDEVFQAAAPDEPKEAETSEAEGATDEAAAEQAEDEEAVPAFTLSAQEGDDQNMLRLKAALRLLKSYQVTTKALQTCTAAPVAAKALKDFHGRNGNTLAPPVMNVIKDNGGLTPEIKTAMDAEVAADTEALLQLTDCQVLTDLVAKGARDLYKAPELAEDYKLVRTKP